MSEPPPSNDLEPPTSTALLAISPVGFHLRPPPPPHELDTFITPDASLFETIHMGAAVVDPAKYRLVVDGLVAHPLTLSLADLRHRFPQTTVTAFHECYGSPLTPPIKALWRVGNVAWTGVALQTLLACAGGPLAGARFVVSEGLDRGDFGGRKGIEAYVKDVSLEKAREPEVLVAWAMNGEALRKERGGPVRLVVPGWFGTNSTKWLCRLSVRAERAQGPFTTVWYNERDLMTDTEGEEEEEGDGGGGGAGLRPVWMVEPNSMITSPAPGARIGRGGGRSGVEVRGWAWSADGVKDVRVSADGGESWVRADVAQRIDVSWQLFGAALELPEGKHQLMARATSLGGVQQPLSGRRNHVHTVAIEVTNGNVAIEPG